MPLCQKEKTSSQSYSTFLKPRSNFEHSETKK